MQYKLLNNISYVTCTVVKVIDIGSESENSGSHTIDVSGEDYGYIVSHHRYGQSDYRVSRNWTLTLTGLKSSRVEIEFEYLILSVGSNGECDDYLQINSLSKMCESPAGKITVELPSTASNSINFNLVTSRANNDDGFWLQYKGMYFINL